MPQKSFMRPFIIPIPEVRLRYDPDMGESGWSCPRCKGHNDEGDSTCLSCGQDVSLKGVP